MGVFLCLLGVLCLFATPVLLIVFAISRKKKKDTKKVGRSTAICAILALPLIILGAIVNSVENPTTEENPTGNDGNSFFNSSGEIGNEVVDMDTSMLKVLMDAGYTLEHATKIVEILNGVGIESIKIDVMTGDPEKGLNAVMCYPNGETKRDKRFRFTTEDGIVFNAGFLDEDLYDVEKGGYLKKYTDVHIPEKTVDMETYTTLQVMAETEVKKYLNYPNTAQFGMLDWGVGRSDENYKIIGKVTAQNALGVKDEISFSVWFKQSGNGFSVEGVALNGQRVK